MSKKAYEIAGVIGTIDPQSVTTTEVFTDVIDMDDWDQVLFVFSIGVAGDTDAIVARVVTCTSAGASAAAFKTASTRTAHATDNDNKQIVISVSAEDLAGGTASTADRYVKGGLVAASAGTLASCVVLGMVPKHGPANDSDLATVVEIEDDKD